MDEIIHTSISLKMDEIIHTSTSLKMDATSVSSKADPDILMTVPCSHRVGVYMWGWGTQRHS